MPEPLICTRCGSDVIVPRVRVIDRGDSNSRQDMEVEVQRRPSAMIFKRPQRSMVWAQVCGGCGHVELYAESPRELYTAFLESDSTQSVSALEELERTREALADSQIRLHELEQKLAFVEQLIESRPSNTALPKQT